MDNEDLSPKDIARVLGNRFIKDYIESGKNNEAQVPEEEKERIVQSIIAEVKTQNKEMHWLKQSLINLTKESKQLHSQVEEWTTISNQQRKALNRMGHVVGAVIFLALSVGLYEFFVKVAVSND